MAGKLECAGKQGDVLKSHQTKMPTTGMGGKGKIMSPVENFPNVGSRTGMPTGQVTGKSKIDSPVASNQ